eukprot:jgi/Mesen1/9108/ME000058S08602
MAAASAFPPPPAYYKLYTDSNEEEGLCPPPPPPISGEYMLFGAPYRTEEVFPSLEEQGVRQVYPKDQDLDVKAELRALCRELLVLTLELADVLAERPSQYARRVEDISLLLKNIHHLLNTLRPHQVSVGVGTPPACPASRPWSQQQGMRERSCTQSMHSV